MRIVSQNREVDTPYEKVLLYVIKAQEKYHIFISFGFDDTYDFSIGAYNTKERCLEIIQEIREAAMGVMFVNDSIPKKEFDELIEQMRNQPVQNIIMQENNIRVVGETYFYMPEE